MYRTEKVIVRNDIHHRGTDGLRSAERGEYDVKVNDAQAVITGCEQSITLSIDAYRQYVHDGIITLAA